VHTALGHENHPELFTSKGSQMTRSFKAGVAAAAVVGLSFVQPAFAHHVMGGQLPSTAWYGLLSGLGHPIIGLDHFSFIVGVGLMSQLVGRIFLLPLLFVAGTILGCFIHIQGYNLVWSEAAIALTIAIAATIVGTHARIPIIILGGLFFVAGAFHGYAYGESIVGAETAPLAAYIIGFGVIQYCIAVLSGVAMSRIVRQGYLSDTMATRIAGGGLAVVAAIAFVNVALVG
jgi:urease accessory protein